MKSIKHIYIFLNQLHTFEYCLIIYALSLSFYDTLSPRDIVNDTKTIDNATDNSNIIKNTTKLMSTKPTAVATTTSSTTIAVVVDDDNHNDKEIEAEKRSDETEEEFEVTKTNVAISDTFLVKETTSNLTSTTTTTTSTSTTSTTTSAPKVTTFMTSTQSPKLVVVDNFQVNNNVSETFDSSHTLFMNAQNNAQTKVPEVLPTSSTTTTTTSTTTTTTTSQPIVKSDDQVLPNSTEEPKVMHNPHGLFIYKHNATHHQEHPIRDHLTNLSLPFGVGLRDIASFVVHRISQQVTKQHHEHIKPLHTKDDQDLPPEPRVELDDIDEFTLTTATNTAPPPQVDTVSLNEFDESKQLINISTLPPIDDKIDTTIESIVSVEVSPSSIKQDFDGFILWESTTTSPTTSDVNKTNETSVDDRVLVASHDSFDLYSIAGTKNISTDVSNVNINLSTPATVDNTDKVNEFSNEFSLSISSQTPPKEGAMIIKPAQDNLTFGKRISKKLKFTNKLPQLDKNELDHDDHDHRNVFDDKIVKDKNEQLHNGKIVLCKS